MILPFAAFAAPPAIQLTIAASSNVLRAMQETLQGRTANVAVATAAETATHPQTKPTQVYVQNMLGTRAPSHLLFLLIWPLACLLTASRMSANWNTDTGATKHMTPHRHWFQTYTPHVVPVCLANGAIILSAGIGSVVFQPDDYKGKKLDCVTFFDVLHVPELANNLLSLFNLTRDRAFNIAISGSSVEFRSGLKMNS